MSSPLPAEAEEAASDGAATLPARSESRETSKESTAMPTASSGDQPSNTRRCFICLVDEPEDKLPADWCTPCVCSVQGHQACLLDWVADLESQGKDIKCPVCKSPIQVSDPWSPVLELNRIAQRYSAVLSPWVLGIFFATGLVFSSTLYGIHAVEVFAGSDAVISYVLKPKVAEEARERLSDRIIAKLKNAIPNMLKRDQETTQEILAQHGIDEVPQVNLLHLFSLNLVGPALILNRIQGTDVFMIPSTLVYATLFSDQRKDLVAWPPSPQVALAAFPTVKSIYYSLYRYAALQIDKRLNPTTPALAENQHEAAAQGDIIDHDFGDDDNLIDIQIDLQLGPVERQDEPVNGEGEAPAPVHRNQQLGNAVTSFLNYLAGTLMWPTLSFGMGTLLQHVLPRGWVTRPHSGPPTGLLQERWGRSLVGGCLLAVLRDTFSLYVKYRKAVNRSRRQIKNADAESRHDTR